MVDLPYIYIFCLSSCLAVVKIFIWTFMLPVSICTIKVFTEGITNRLLGCQHKDDVNQTDVLLIRVYGEKTDLIIDR